MDVKHVRDYLLAKPEAIEDYPFGPEVMVFKVKGKMFALLSVTGGKNSDQRPQMNLKCDPLEATQLRDVFDDVVAGYHMNKKHWMKKQDHCRHLWRHLCLMNSIRSSKNLPCRTPGSSKKTGGLALSHMRGHCKILPLPRHCLPRMRWPSRLRRGTLTSTSR